MKNKKLAALILLILTSILPTAICRADQDTDNDTCIEGDTIGITANAATLGYAAQISRGFKMLPNMYDDKKNGTEYCKLIIGNEDKIDYSFDEGCLTSVLGSIMMGVGFVSEQSCNPNQGKVSSIKIGETKFLSYDPPIEIGAFRVGREKVCIQSYNGIIGWYNLGCRFAEMPPVAPYDKPCAIAESCVKVAASNSKNILPVTAMAVQCMKETLSQIFVTGTSCASGQSLNYLTRLQSNFHNTVMLLLVLYFTVIGLKITLSKEGVKRGEAFMFIAKAIFVIYFSVGFPTGARDVDGNLITQSGVADLYEFFVNASMDFANFMMQSTTSNGLCKFDSKDYADGYNYLMLWDTIDCRIVTYLGMNVVSKSTAVGHWVLIIPALLSGDLFFAFALIAFIVLFLSVMLFILNMFLISLFIITLLVLVAPIFVPMMLFEFTKQYYDSWLRLVMGYTLQPTVLIAFVSIMLVTMDSLMFHDCQFKMQSMFGTKYQYAQVLETNSVQCKKSFGYRIWDPSIRGRTVLDEYIGWINMFPTWISNTKFPIFVASKFWYDSSAAYGTLLKIILFMVLFFYFASLVDGLVNDLTNAASLSGMAHDNANTMTKAGEVYAQKKTDAVLKKWGKK